MTIKECIICKQKFKARVPHKKICSPKCRKIHQKQYHQKKYYEETGNELVENCLFCGEKIEGKSRSARYCSNSCAKRAEYSRIKEIEKQCVHCNKTFFTKRKDTIYCSIACVNTAVKKHPDITKNCEYCNKEFTTTYIRRTKRFCSKSCANIGENNAMFGMTGSLSPTFGQIPWTKGKTAKTDAKLAALGEKISIKLKEQFATGERSNAGENNPMFDKNHSIKSREQMSDVRSQKIVNGDYSSWFDKGTIFSKKMNKDIPFKSSWEKNAIKFFDSSPDIVSFKYEPFRIPYLFEGLHRNYIPDFLITYRNGTKKLIEIKPVKLSEMPLNQAKFTSAQAHCSTHNLTFEIWTEKNTPQLLQD